MVYIFCSFLFLCSGCPDITVEREFMLAPVRLRENVVQDPVSVVHLPQREDLFPVQLDGAYPVIPQVFLRKDIGMRIPADVI